MRRALPSALAVFVLLFAGEGAARLRLGSPSAEWRPADFQYGYVEPLTPYYEPVSRDGRVVAYRGKRRGAAGWFFAPKPAGTLRVFAVGGSVAIPMSDIGLLAQQQWRKALPGRTVELLTMGMNGYDSERDLPDVREALSHEADLVVVLSGNNEGQAPRLMKHPKVFLANRALRAHSWLWRLAQDRVAGRPAAVPRDAARATADFEANLRAMAREAKRARVPLVLCTLPANLADLPPAAGGPRRADADFAAGWTAWERGDPRAASGAWRRFVARFPDDAYGAYFLAKALERQGSVAEAGRLYRLAADLDQFGSNRCPPARNAVIRKVAREEGVLLADLEADFARLARGAAPGLELLFDDCHWYQPLYDRVMADVLDAAWRGGALAQASQWDWSWRPAAETALRRPEPHRERYAARPARAALARMAGEDGRELSERTLAYVDSSMTLDPALWATEAAAAAAGLDAKNPRLRTYVAEARRRRRAGRAAL